jgi:hypothetical protein
MNNGEKYLFGSALTKKYFPDFRAPKDVDWVVFDKNDTVKTITGVEEYHFLPVAPHREMTPNELYTLKVSHAIYDIHWAKTMSDLRFFQIKGCQIDRKFLAALRDYWKEVHGEQKRTNFNVDPKKFFSDKVKRKIPHDELHVMLVDPPTYLKMVEEINPIETKFFNDMTDTERMDTCFEEAFVIALERFDNPHVGDRTAYCLAQQALVTRIHHVWLADYIIEHWNSYFWNASNSRHYVQYKKLKKDFGNDYYY